MARRQALKRLLASLVVFILIIGLVLTGMYFANNGLMRLAVWQNSGQAYVVFEDGVGYFNENNSFVFTVVTRMDSPSIRYTTTAKARVLRVVEQGVEHLYMSASVTVVKSYNLYLPDDVGTTNLSVVYDDGMLYLTKGSTKTKYAATWSHALNLLLGDFVDMLGAGVNPIRLFPTPETEYETQPTKFVFSINPLYLGVSKTKTVEYVSGYEKFGLSLGMFGAVRGQSYAKNIFEGGDKQNYTLSIGYHKTGELIIAGIVPEGIAEQSEYQLIFD